MKRSCPDPAPNHPSQHVNSGPSNIELDTQVTYSVSPNSGATAYKLYLWEVVEGSGTIGAESSEEAIVSTSDSYDVRQQSTVNNGSYAFA